MVLAHRERLTPKPTQAALAAQRMRDYADKGMHPGPLPTPGVFARHNAVDTPALLPDGTAAEASVSRVLAARGTVRSAPALADDIEDVQRQIGDAPHAGAPPRRTTEEETPMSVTPYIVLSAILFTIGCVGVLTRRNAIVVFMCVELMLNASNLALVAFGSTDLRIESLLLGMTPSLLYPMSTRTSSLSMRTTLPVTTSPSSKGTMVAS